MASDDKTQQGRPPASPEEYLKRLIGDPSCDLESQKKLYFELSTRFLQRVEASVLWQDFLSELDDYEQAYFIKTRLELLYQGTTKKPLLLVKDYNSYFGKCFRYAFLKKNLPANLSASRQALPHPADFIGYIDDIVRTLLVVKFLDGVEFVINRMQQLCNKHGVTCTIQYKSNDEGYFAAHVYIPLPMQFTDLGGNRRTVDLPFEIQISTQLQEVLRRFLHFQYEKSRMTGMASDVPWQWRYRDDEFFTNGLGHALRNIEGQIMEARRRKDIADANN